MKRVKFFVMLPIGMMFFLISCGGNEEKKSSESTDSTASTVTTPATTAPVNTTVTTPQNMMVVEHHVADFAKWKASYDEHDSMRLASGVHDYVIGRGLQDSNRVLVAVKVDDLDKAKAFAKDPNLKKAMQKGGVTGAPEISFTTMVFQDTGAVSSPLRSRLSLNVKDWDAWQKSFVDGTQERLDNGLTTRAYGHDASNNKKVTVVLAVTDTTKAFAYFKSDALKKRREAGGVIGEPQRFLYKVVQRY